MATPASACPGACCSMGAVARISCGSLVFSFFESAFRLKAGWRVGDRLAGVITLESSALRWRCLLLHVIATCHHCVFVRTSHHCAELSAARGSVTFLLLVCF